MDPVGGPRRDGHSYLETNRISISPAAIAYRHATSILANRLEINRHVPTYN
jgi:hypothetical protein